MGRSRRGIGTWAETMGLATPPGHCWRISVSKPGSNPPNCSPAITFSSTLSFTSKKLKKTPPALFVIFFFFFQDGSDHSGDAKDEKDLAPGAAGGGAGARGAHLASKILGQVGSTSKKKR